jgi:alkylhydroperoxidase family enzyme
VLDDKIDSRLSRRTGLPRPFMANDDLADLASLIQRLRAVRLQEAELIDRIEAISQCLWRAKVTVVAGIEITGNQ